ncbi:hypothetical protein A3Q56_06916 [Intoshia linei]|uniref:Uncharacterized protein n=1 Tax=Intoshia linei TaxID=1819745 RepID=A0A177AVD6_9BILA|nr:hypothetical protein A3Q56_06916 [Intoshia linei]
MLKYNHGGFKVLVNPDFAYFGAITTADDTPITAITVPKTYLTGIGSVLITNPSPL